MIDEMSVDYIRRSKYFFFNSQEKKTSLITFRGCRVYTIWWHFIWNLFSFPIRSLSYLHILYCKDRMKFHFRMKHTTSNNKKKKKLYIFTNCQVGRQVGRQQVQGSRYFIYLSAFVQFLIVGNSGTFGKKKFFLQVFILIMENFLA